MTESHTLGLIKETKDMAKEIYGTEGRRTLYITNLTEDNIELQFNNKKSEVIGKGITRIYSLDPKDGFFHTTNYECHIRSQDRSLKFWAYGKRAPREDNIFEVTSEGIVLKKVTKLSATRFIDSYLIDRWA